MPTMTFTKQAAGGGAGPAQQTLEETKKWAKLRRACEANGQMDVQVKVIGVKHPHQIVKSINGVKAMTNWGDETPEAERFKQNDKGERVAMKPGVLITFEATQPGIEGLRFYADGTYSANEKTPVFKVGNAIYRGKLIGMAVDPDTDFIDKELIITVVANGEHDRKTVDGHPAKAGCYWNIRGYRPVPREVSLTDDDDDDFPTVATTVAATAKAAPASVAAGLDDDLDLEDVPF